MTEAPGTWTETRLQTSVACRVWTPDHGCYSALEWERAREALPTFRAAAEAGRLRISEALGVEGVDPLGVGRQLLIHETTASLSRAAIREAGFVHLESASGIHLLILAALVDRALRAVHPRAGAAIRALVPLAIWTVVFALTGFRPGLLRPLALVGIRALAARFGYRLRPFTPIACALAIDAGIGFVLSFGSPRTFADWAPGELHYAAAWAGGVLGYRFVRERGYGRFAAHLGLAFAAWLAVLPLDFVAGRFAPATPILSLLTIEFLGWGGYAALFGCAFLTSLGGPGFARSGLQWGVALVNRALALVCPALFTLGAVRTVPEELGEGLAVFFVIGGIGLLAGLSARSTAKVDAKH